MDINVISRGVMSSVPRSGCKTGKRPQPDRDWTGKNRKKKRPKGTATEVRSAVSHKVKLF
jgi:hypothetical protein